MNKLAASIIGSFVFAGALALASCSNNTTTTGSGTPPIFGGNPPGPGTGPGPAPGPSGTRVQVLASSPQMPSSGTVTVDLTAIVVDANGQAVSGTTVVLSTGTDPSAFISNISAGGVSDTNGTVTAKLNLGSNKSNRFISITASAVGATAATGVDVTGTAITVSGNSSLALGATTALTFSLKDSAGVALPGFTMTLASAAGNSISPATGTTNSAGQLVTTVTGNVGGNDTITATAAGASKTQALTVSGAGFAFTAPAPSVDIPLNTPTAVSVHWTTSAGAAVVGQPVTFATSRGTIAGSPSTTDGNGDTPGVSISSTTAGTATVTASGPGGTPAASINVTFVATTASSIAAQAVPGAVQTTTGVASQTNNKSTISVVVRDAANNLVKNAGVDFNLTDTTGGSLNASHAITDVTGGAAVTYTAGTVSSAQNGVAIQATVTDIGGVPVGGPAITDTATLTVSGQSLLVRLGTDNLVLSQPPLYKKTWVAVVTDATGNAVSNATVLFALRPGRYNKGTFDFFDTTASTWHQNITATCQNEDFNFNGNLDPGEDFNGNGKLEPGGVATVNATAVTDSSGIAIAVITYPKDHAFWAEYILEARTAVTSNDPPTLATFFLVGAANDYSDKTTAPPGQISPYGSAAVCSNPN